MLNICPVVLIFILLVKSADLQVLHLLSLHEWNPKVWCVFTAAWTKISLKFFDLLKDKIGKLDIAFLHLSDDCNIWKYFPKICVMFGRPGLKVVVNGTLSNFLLLFFLLKVSCLLMSLSLSKALSMSLSRYCLLSKKSLSSLSRFRRNSLVEHILKRRKAQL